MDKKGESNKLLTIILLLMIVFIGIALITNVANTKETQTDKVTITNEYHSIASARIGTTKAINTSYKFYVTNAPTGWKQKDCKLTNFVLGNASKDYTLTTDYVVNLTDGSYTLKNTLNVNNSKTNASYIDYKYCADGYLTNSGDRSLANMWTTLMILVILVVLVGGVYKMYKE